MTDTTRAVDLILADDFLGPVAGAMAEMLLPYVMYGSSDSRFLATFRNLDDAQAAAAAMAPDHDALLVVDLDGTPPDDVVFAMLRELSGMEWHVRRTTARTGSPRAYDVRRGLRREGVRSTAKPGVVAFYASSIADAARQLGIEEA